MDLGGVARAPRGDAEGRHLLRDEMVEARHDVEGRFGRHAARPSGDRGGIRERLVRRRLPEQPSAGRRDGGRAWIAYEYGGDPLDPSTAGRPGSSSRTCTSGRAPSGSEDSSSSSRTDRGSGRPPATTTTATRGGSSAMTATEISMNRSRPRETP